jgi:hypothetical protein
MPLYHATLPNRGNFVALQHGGSVFTSAPRPHNDLAASETEFWPVKKKWALKMLNEVRRQLANIHVSCGEKAQRRVGLDAQRGLPVFGDGQERPGLRGTVCGRRSGSRRESWSLRLGALRRRESS